MFELLPNKTKDSYDRVGRELLNLNINLQPATIMIVFEQALFGAFTEVSVNTKIRGCFFFTLGSVYGEKYKLFLIFVENIFQMQILL